MYAAVILTLFLVSAITWLLWGVRDVQYGGVAIDPQSGLVVIHAPAASAAVLQALAWPAVAIVAIIALFLIARQAIAGDRNVEIAWKVTEKVTGRVVITKVKTAVPKARKAA